MAPVRVGIIGVRAVPEGDEAAPGAGTWAVTSHLPALQAMPEAYKIVAVCNSSVESAELASMYPEIKLIIPMSRFHDGINQVASL